MAKIEGKITITDKEGNSIVMTIEEAKKLANDLQSTLVEEKIIHIPTGFREVPIGGDPFGPYTTPRGPYTNTHLESPNITYCIGD